MNRKDLSKARRIWLLDKDEKHFVQSLPPEERKGAKSYLTAMKLASDRQKKALPTLQAIMRRWQKWQKWREADTDSFTDYLSKHENPFYLFLQQQNLDEYDIHEEVDQMGLLLLGHRLYNLDPNLSKEDGDRPLWAANDPDKFIRRTVRFAKEMLEELPVQYKMTVGPPRPSGKKAHTTSAQPDKEMSPPTMGDALHINSNLEELDMGNDWVFEHTLYQRGDIGSSPQSPKHRIVHLFAKVDKDGNLHRRVVVKVEGFYDAQDVEKDREEYRIHRDLFDINSHFILDCYGHSTRTRKPRGGPSPPHLLYGYLEYAPYGDLYDLATAARQGNYFISEFYLWIIFRGLAVAIFNLEMGPIAARIRRSDLRLNNDEFRQKYKAEGWKSIVNLDIKPGNVVLGEPHEDYPAFPCPKMMDFGICMRHPTSTRKRVKLNVLDAMDGTFGWMSPEQLQKNGVVRGTDYKDDIGKTISVHSHIFAIGLIMLNLMNRATVTIGHMNNEAAPTHLRDYDYMYSTRLEGLVSQCVELVPAERPTLPELLGQTLAGMKAGRARAWTDPFRRQKRELEPSMLPKDWNGRQPKIGEFMGEAWRYPKRRRVMEEGAEAEEDATDQENGGEGATAWEESTSEEDGRVEIEGAGAEDGTAGEEGVESEEEEGVRRRGISRRRRH